MQPPVSLVRVRSLARELLSDGHFDTDADAVRAAIRLIAAAETLERAECIARHPSMQSGLAPAG